ncbi:MAG: DUF2480 family protein [Flavobacteriales bacterium]|nr:DUF2480 family protein [Flavobacteriales bacterium]
MSEIRNKISESGLITLDMKSFKGSQKRFVIDIKNWLFNGMVLKEKIFREHLKNENWSQYENTFVALNCSADTIVPIWSYMLITKYLKPYSQCVVFGDEKSLERKIFEVNIDNLDLAEYKNKRVLLKGCTDIYIPDESYVQISNKLMGTVKSLMFGEACSNVPIFKA